MDEQTTPPVTEVPATQNWKKHFTSVTPLSKFLAMLLFIIMPFAGFGLGVKYGKEVTIQPYSNSTQATSKKTVTEQEQQNVNSRQPDASAECPFPIDEYTFYLPAQESAFNEPGGKYTLNIPAGMVYRYATGSPEYPTSILYLWTDELWELRRKEILEHCSIEGGSGFTIEFVPEEQLTYFQQLTDAEITRQVLVGENTVLVYQPVNSFAGHEEVRITVPGGALVLINPLIGENSKSDFDLIINNITSYFSDEKNMYAAARKYVAENSIDGIRFSLEFRWRKGEWVNFLVVPENVETDNVQLFMRKDGPQWVLEGFGTAFPDLYEEHPELFEE